MQLIPQKMICTKQQILRFLLVQLEQYCNPQRKLLQFFHFYGRIPKKSEEGRLNGHIQNMEKCVNMKEPLKNKIAKYSDFNLLLLNVVADSEQQFSHQECLCLQLQHQLQEVYHVHFHENDQLPKLTHEHISLQFASNQTNVLVLKETNSKMLGKEKNLQPSSLLHLGMKCPNIDAKNPHDRRQMAQSRH